MRADKLKNTKYPPKNVGANPVKVDIPHRAVGALRYISAAFAEVAAAAATNATNNKSRHLTTTSAPIVAMTMGAPC